jgi:hypothetical protein
MTLNLESSKWSFESSYESSSESKSFSSFDFFSTSTATKSTAPKTCARPFVSTIFLKIIEITSQDEVDC